MIGISIYKNVLDNVGTNADLLDMLKGIKDGRWQDDVFEARSRLVKDKSLYDEFKRTVPAFTVSARFEKRGKAYRHTPSGFISIDFDKLPDMQNVRQLLEGDPYTYSLFESLSGKGYACIVKIPLIDHERSFLALEQYYDEKYDLSVDEACKDVTRLRIASYDPSLYLNEGSRVFEELYKPIVIAPKKLPSHVYAQRDIDFIFSQLRQNRIDISRGDYRRFQTAAHALVAEYGDGAENMIIDLYLLRAGKSDINRATEKAKHLIKFKGERVSIATFFYYCKDCNVEIRTPRTQQVLKQVQMHRKAGSTAAEVVADLDATGLVGEDKLINDAINAKSLIVEFEETEDEVVEFVRKFYNITYNELTQNYFINGQPFSDRILNTMYLRMRPVFQKRFSKDLVESIIKSDYAQNVNPVKDWLSEKVEHYRKRKDFCDSECEKLIKLLPSDTGSHAYRLGFFKSWYAGIVDTIMEGGHNPLILLLVGRKQGTGKTTFFRELLPPEIRDYYAQNDLRKENDAELAMSQKLLILKDEMVSHRGEEMGRFKQLLSADSFFIREPYGRAHRVFKRIATLAGTANDESALVDPTGNRRFVVFRVTDVMDTDAYRKIDKTAAFFSVFFAWENGDIRQHLDSAQVLTLKSEQGDFEATSEEEELLLSMYQPASDDNYQMLLSSSEIKAFIQQKYPKAQIYLNRVTAALKKNGFVSVVKWHGGRSVRGYPVNVAIDGKIIEESYPNSWDM